ncbi:hypothetical protein HDV02_005299 [Globomyces sp. JEL0801]|nr:hypothetical protein HDV02_005299 [Globomyces sp. JEL0801]
MDRSYDKAILYRFGNGTYEEAKIPRPTTTVVVDWVFPEKMKGEYIKYDMSVHFDPMGLKNYTTRMADLFTKIQFMGRKSYFNFHGFKISVRITKFTTDIRHNTDAPNIVYKFGNGTAKGASVAGSGDVGSVFVDWVFPEKMKGEYIKYYQPFPDLASTEKLYYKVGRSIYKNSVVGEEKVFQLPWFQNVKFEIVVDSIGQFLLMIDE